MSYKHFAQNRIRRAKLQRILRMANKYDDRVKHLKSIVKKEDITMSQLIRKMIKEYLAKNQKEQG